MEKHEDIDPGRFERRMEEYDGYHRHPINRKLHAIGIPLIVVGVAGLIGKAELSTNIPFAVFCIVLMAIWLAANCGMIMCVVMCLFYTIAVLAGTILPAWVLLPGLVTGSALLLIGHRFFERRSPAFLTNTSHLLVGPVHLVVQLMEGQSDVPPSRRNP